MKHGKWMWIGIALVVGLLIMGAMKYKSGCGQGKRIPNVSFDPLRIHQIARKIPSISKHCDFFFVTP